MNLNKMNKDELSKFAQDNLRVTINKRKKIDGIRDEIRAELKNRNLTAEQAEEAVEKEAIEELKQTEPSLNTDWSGEEIKWLRNKGGKVFAATPILITQMKVMELTPCDGPEK
tara:strand:- start:699 stop:1037 length:339 start_codon:yes stop_codon:yes gene_type:complete